MALVITKKVRTILLIVLSVLVVGGGGFLIWRVTQEESIAPEDSAAYSDPTDNIRGGEYIEFPCDGELITIPDVREDYGQYVCGDGCMSTTPEEGNGGLSDAQMCPPQRVFNINADFLEGVYSITGVVGRGHYTNTQSQTNEDFILSINNLPNDVPKEVTGSSTGYKEENEEIGTFHILEGQNTVTMDHLRTCPPLDDANSVHLYKLCLEQVNVCNKGIAILPDPENDFGTLEDPVLTIQTDDVDGIGKVTTAKLNGTDIPSCQAQDGAACYEISGTNIHIFVAPGLKDIPAGAYNVNIAWTDGKGIGGSNCKMQSSFEVLGEKIGDPVCGTLTGNYSSDTTDWPEGTFCSAGEPEPPNPEFPSLGGSTTWTCSNSDGIEVSCNATRDNITEAPIVPQTGVFDSVLGRVSVGVSFIFLGGLVSQYSKFNYLLNSISEKQQFRSEVKKQRKAKKRREKLEENFK